MATGTAMKTRTDGEDDQKDEDDDEAEGGEYGENWAPIGPQLGPNRPHTSQ